MCGLHTTPTTQVMEWLSDLGASELVEGPVSLPNISREQLDLLLTSDPMFSKPKLDRCVEGCPPHVVGELHSACRGASPPKE
jgi:hypothetical protein